jgi:formate hydrogenlyase subunit 6/NADH:ubiquinone oxidoreductase subunit I
MFPLSSKENEIKIYIQVYKYIVMPVGIIPDISEQMCIGCALCVEICTTLGPDVLRVKPVEGWKRGKAFVFYPTKAIFWMRPMDFTVGQPVPLYKNSVFVKGWTELID